MELVISFRRNAADGDSPGWSEERAQPWEHQPTSSPPQRGGRGLLVARLRLNVYESATGLSLLPWGGMAAVAGPESLTWAM